MKEYPILLSVETDREIRELCGAKDQLEKTLENVPEGSCSQKLVSAQLEGVRTRLAELGINGEVVLFEREEEPSLIGTQGAGVAQVIISLHYLRQLAGEKLKVEDAGRWLQTQEKRKARR